MERSHHASQSGIGQHAAAAAHLADTSPPAQPGCGSSMWSPSVRRPPYLNSAGVPVIVSRLRPRSREMFFMGQPPRDADYSMGDLPRRRPFQQELGEPAEIKCDGPEADEITCVPHHLG